MDAVYDIQQHSSCIFIHLGNNVVTIAILSNWSIHAPNISGSKIKTCTLESRFIFDKETKEIFSWTFDEKDFVYDKKKHVRIVNLKDLVYRLFQKGRDNWDEDDAFLINAVTVFLAAAVYTSMASIEITATDSNPLHYALIVPSEWEEEIREILLRPIFIQADLLWKEDHKDRLLFFSDIESICYQFENTSINNYMFKRGVGTIFCRITPIDGRTLLIKFDLLQTVNSLYSFPNSKLFPKVARSNSFSIGENDIRNCIKSFLETKLLLPVEQDLIESMVLYIFTCSLPDQFSRSFDDKLVDLLNENAWYTLDDTNKSILKTLRIYDLCADIYKAFFKNMDYILSDITKKEYKLLIFRENYSYNFLGNKFLIKWINYTLVYKMCTLNSIKYAWSRIGISQRLLEPDSIISGASNGVREAIQNSNMNSKPRLLSIENEVSSSSSIFLNSRPNAIVYIDISLKSTLLSCALLGDDGLVDEVFDHCYFTANRGLSPLGSFYKTSNTAILDVSKQFITLAESYLLGDLNHFSADKNVAAKNNIISEIETILNVDYSSDTVLISTQQQVYIKAFFFMYMIYIKELISSKLPVHLMASNNGINIGYAVSIEKILLDNIIGTKDDLRDIIYTSGLIHSEDNSKKLRIITQGEVYLPTIKETLELELQLRSYFVLVQLHEDYIQLTLNQVVTESSVEKKEKEQEAIIIQDEIIRTQNIYDSLCLNIWNNMLENTDLIQLCDIHDKSDGTAEALLFSVRIKKHFMSNLKDYITNKLFTETSNWKYSDVDLIQLSGSCSCHIFLTVEDILDISFKPVIRDIVSILSASLVNTDIFGNYLDIQYVFTIICFNYNVRFQNILQRILKENIGDLTLEMSYFFIPGPLNKNLQPVLMKRPFMYKGFRMGTLYQVYSNSCAFYAMENSSEKQFLCKARKEDTIGIDLDGMTALLLVKKGGILSSSPIKRLFYLTPRQILDVTSINILFGNFHTINNIKHDRTISVVDNIHTAWRQYQIQCELIRQEKNIPIIVSVISKGYRSSLLLSARIAGGDSSQNQIIELGESMSLCRF